MPAVDVPTRKAGFERRLALTYQQAVRARAEVEGMYELAGHARDTAGALVKELRSERPEAPMARLAKRLELGPEHVELVWTLVACSVDGRLLPHLEALGGGHARRGLRRVRRHPRALVGLTQRADRGWADHGDRARVAGGARVRRVVAPRQLPDG